MFRAFIVVLFCGLTSILQAQTLKYKVVWRGDSVGHIKANRYDSTNFQIYRINSRVAFRFLGDRSVDMDFESVYNEGSLFRSKVDYFRDGKLRNTTQVYRNGNGYDIFVDGEKEDELDIKKIRASISSIYYNEPDGVSELLLERHGKMSIVQKQKAGHYTIRKPDGRYNEYVFKDGICKYVVVDNFFATFKFELLDQ